jgi:hypothetical protein
MACEEGHDAALRTHLETYSAAVSRITFPDTTSQQVAQRVEAAITDMAPLLAAAPSLGQYQSLTDALDGQLSQDSYEVQDSTTYLGSALNNMAAGRPVAG